MQFPCTPVRSVLRLVVLTLLLFLCTPFIALAQETNVPRLELMPSCTAATDCPSFEVRDPQSLQTPPLNAGDMLDMDLVLHNPNKAAIERFRVWIAYDPMLLSGASLRTDERFSIPTPGEQNFIKEEGLLKIGASAQEAVTDDRIVLARISMRVLPSMNSGSPLMFYDDAQTPEPETGVFIEDASEQNILTGAPGYLFVRFVSTAASESSATSSAPTDSADSAQSSVSIAAPASPAFPLLRVQGLRLTTEGSTVYLVWDALPSSELIGYHLYYGTVSGQYIQRRAIEANAHSISIRSLPEGTTYYFAIRGVGADDRETDFSQEVGISVGNPRTSTAPFTANTLPTVTPPTDGALAGETGVPTILALLLILSAGIGTVIAFRRQLRA